MLPDSRLLLLVLVAGLAAGGWWKRAELKAWLFPPEPVRTDVYSWRDADGNRHYSDRAVRSGAARVEVDTARIGRLEPLPEAAKVQPEEPKELYLQKMGRELKEQREQMRDKHMEKAIYGQ
ncbi:MAG TPA: DUF4124 domain-containing protein [Fluviicoccus sp.]|nr:DUF4124 domain-containing protein [Fluviicoccus sp.]